MRRKRTRLFTDYSNIDPTLIDPSHSEDIKGYCVICGRKLKSEDSKSKGWGRACGAKLKNKKELF